MRSKRIRPEEYLLSSSCCVGSGMRVVFPDPATIVFGENKGLKRRN